MIVICEPICTNFSHEKVNSGFIYGLSLAFPGQKIKIYTDESHGEALKKILLHDKVIIPNIEFCPIQVTDTKTFRGIRYYKNFLDSIFKECEALGVDRIFFSSFDPVILFLIKVLRVKYPLMKYSLVLHGGFENIAGGDSQKYALPLPVPTFVETFEWEKVRQFPLNKRIRKIAGIIRRRIKEYSSVFNRISLIKPFFNFCFSEKRILLWRPSTHFKFIALSPHILANAETYLGLNKIQIFPVILPTIFADETRPPLNKNIKFAVFGYGNSIMLHNVLKQIPRTLTHSQCEIRIIGMDNRGTSEFSFVTSPSNGKKLSRDEMENLAKDIDMFLILYDKSRYRLSCSGSILESLSYFKPILHFDNECINFFNQGRAPIGFQCANIEDFAAKMTDLIENFDAYRGQLDLFRENIGQLREEMRIENSVAAIKAAFTWPENKGL